MVDLVPSSEQQQIVDSVADYLAAEMPVARLRPDAKGAGPDSARWRAMGDLGWFSMALPEDTGGVGLSEVEETLVFRQFGRHLLSPNVLASAIGARVALAAGAMDLALAIGNGGARVALANPVGRSTIGARISGQFHVFDLGDAAWILTIGESGAAALLARSAIADVAPAASVVDGVQIDRVTLAETPATHHVGPEVRAHVLLRLLTGAMLSGVCEATRDLASSYAKIRVQFGQPIGAFQAIKHKCADMALRADAAGALVNFASIAVANGNADAGFQATAAKLLGAHYALLNAKETIQSHGGIGFTVECDAHHFLKRAHLLDQIGGAVRRQQQLLMMEPAPVAGNAL